MSAEYALAKAVLSTFGADPALRAELGDPPRIYDRAPGGATFPFVTLGRAETTPIDADAPSLLDHRLTIHIWGRRDDRDAIRRIIGAARSALHHADLALDTSWRSVMTRVVYADLFTGPDGRSLHGVLRVRALIEELET